MKSQKKNAQPAGPKNSYGKSDPKASIRAGQEVMCETRRELKQWEEENKKSLGYSRIFSEFDQLFESKNEHIRLKVACVVLDVLREGSDEKIKVNVKVEGLEDVLQKIHQKRAGKSSGGE